MSAIIPFLTTIGEIQKEIDAANTVADVEDLCVKASVEPLIASAIESKDPKRCLMPLVDLGHDMDAIVEDFQIRFGASALPEQDKERAIEVAPTRKDVIKSRITSYMRYRAWQLSQSEDAAEQLVAEWLGDIVKFAEAGGWDARPDVKREGLITRIKSHRLYSKKQDTVGRAMAKHAKTPKDVSIWMSRYVLGPAIENAKEGYTIELGGICGFSDEQLVELCCRIASSIGIRAARDDFDVTDVRNSMRMLCRARTGYCAPEIFLLSRLCSI